MKIKKVKLSYAIVLLILNLISCNSSDNLLNLPLEKSITEDNIRYTISLDKSFYSAGENVKIDFTVKKIGTEKKIIYLSTVASDIIIYVRKGDELVFNWPQVWVTIPSSLALESGESKEYSYIWDSKNNIYGSDGYNYYVPPGNYTIAIQLLGPNLPQVSVDIKIKLF